MRNSAVRAACCIRAVSIFSLLFLSCSQDEAPGDQTDPPPSPPVPVIEYTYHIPEKTMDGWLTDSLEAVQMNRILLGNMVMEILRAHYREVHAVLVARKGKLVFEEYFPGHDFNYFQDGFLGEYIDFNRNTPHNTHSLTKSIVSACAGLAIEKGIIGGIQDFVFDYLPAYQAFRDSLKEKITIRHLLTMSSGLDWNECCVPPGDPQYDIYQLDIAPDPIAYLLSKEVTREPGAIFNYNGGTVDLLGEIIHEASGTRLDSFCLEYLFRPLGIGSADFQHLASGFIVAHGDIYMRPRDMAKFGQMYLDDGAWNGKQVLSPGWVAQSVIKQIDIPSLSWATGYGYLWWLNDYLLDGQYYTAFKAMGWGGQEIFVFPDFDMVIVFTGANYTVDPPCDEIVQKYILPAMMDQ